MVRRKNLHTNITMENSRRDRVYQAVITDLTIAGIIPRDKAEMLLGYTIPDFLHTPDNKTVADLQKKQENKLDALKQVTK